MAEPKSRCRGCEPVALVGLNPVGEVPRLPPPGPLSGGELPGAVVGEPELDEPLEVDGGGAVGEPDAVAGGASEGDASAGAHEPGEGAFDHRAPASVVGGEGAVPPGSAGFDEFGVVCGEPEDATVRGGGAAVP